MARVRVYYAKCGCPFRFNVDKNNLPQPSDIEAGYIMVADFEADDTVVPDDVFVQMNTEPESVFDSSAYDRGVQHTSMSVGDIVCIENTGFTCMSMGWHVFKVG